MRTPRAAQPPRIVPVAAEAVRRVGLERVADDGVVRSTWSLRVTPATSSLSSAPRAPAKQLFAAILARSLSPSEPRAMH